MFSLQESSLGMSRVVSIKLCGNGNNARLVTKSSISGLRASVLRMENSIRYYLLTT